MCVPFCLVVMAGVDKLKTVDPEDPDPVMMLPVLNDKDPVELVDCDVEDSGVDVRG
jgi:hypothetical protein